MKKKYQTIPVEEAEKISEKYKKDIIIINSWDTEFGVLHTTTYGVNEVQKHQAAKGGEIASKALGADLDLSNYYQDFRIETASYIEKIKNNIILLEDNTCTNMKETIINDLNLIQKRLGISLPDKKTCNKNK